MTTPRIPKGKRKEIIVTSPRARDRRAPVQMAAGGLGSRSRCFKLLVVAISCLHAAISSELPMIKDAQPAMLAVHSAPSEVTLSGTRLGSCRTVMLSHLELRSSTNVTKLTSTSSSSISFEFHENWAAGSVQVQAVADDSSVSNSVILNLFSSPNITSVTPNRTSVAGGGVVTLRGLGFIPSSALLVSITTDEVSQVVSGTYLEEADAVQIQMPQFPIPDSVEISDIGPGEEVIFSATIRLSWNGFNFEESTIGLDIVISSVLKLGYLYVGPVNDFGWTYNWNLGRMDVDSRHPSIVTSEYLEYVPEEMFSDTPAEDQEAATTVREYCERNFDLVVGTSFGFLDAMVHMSSEPVCNFLFDETTGLVTSTPKTTYMLHATGYIQTPTLATIFTKVYEMKYLAGVLAGNQMVSEGSANHLVGVVASFPIVEQFRHINAFIRGCVEADPLCRVAVIWTMTWHDEFIEKHAG